MKTSSNPSTTYSPAQKPKVCAVILNWNGLADTKECITSLLKVDYPNLHIIVVDNGSENREGVRIKECFPTIDLLPLPKNCGFATGNNEGIVFALRKYKPPYILLLNNDTVVDAKFIDALVDAAENYNDANVIVPRINRYDKRDTTAQAGGKVSKFTGIVKEFGKNKPNYQINSNPFPTRFMSGCAALIKRATIEEIGLFDEQFFAYSEDTDYTLRILKKGYKILLAPEATVYHKESNSLRGDQGLKMKYFLATRNLVLLQRKHLKKQVFPLFLGWFCIRWTCYISIKLLATGKHKAIPAVWQGYGDGVRNRIDNNF